MKESKADSNPNDQQPTTILMVDDESPNRKILRRYVDRSMPGFDFLESEAPDHAINTHLSTTRGRGLGLIATDYRMPGGTFGDDFARLMRGQEVAGRRLDQDIVDNLSAVPIVMLSGDIRLEEDFRRLIHQGILDHLILKPYEEEQIREMLRRQVAGTLRNT